MKNRSKNNQAGFTLLQVVIGISIAVIVITGMVQVVWQSNRILTRQRILFQAEKELTNIDRSMREPLTTLPGRNLTYYNGETFNVASELPTNGGIPLGIVTPYRIGPYDAITILYGDPTRFELIETSQQAGSTGTAIAISGNNASAQSFQAGDLMMLCGNEPQITTGAVGRLVRLTSQPTQVTTGQPARSAWLFSYNLCDSGACVPHYPYLTNATQLKKFPLGSVIVPVNLASFYLAQRLGTACVVRNDGGSLVITENGGDIVGGRESILGEADVLKINYVLQDASRQPTPASPTVPWLHQIATVEVSITKTLSLPTGEKFTKSLDLVYPLVIRRLE